MMTADDRDFRIRILAAWRGALEQGLRDLELEAGPIEREHSRSLGFSFPPLRGKALLDVMDREQAKAA